MPNDQNQPGEYDAVLGGQNSTPVDAAVLGGIAGVKSRLASPAIEETRRLKPRLHKQNPPARVKIAILRLDCFNRVYSLVRGGGLCLCSSGFNRRMIDN